MLALGRMVEAIVLVRRETGLDLRGAVDLLAGIEAAAPYPIHRWPDEGLSAEVLAIGPFRHELVGVMGYDEGCYPATREGAPIVVSVVEVDQHTRVVEELAAIVGLESPWDFAHQHLDPHKVAVERWRRSLAFCRVDDGYLLRLCGTVPDRFDLLERHLPRDAYYGIELEDTLGDLGLSASEVEASLTALGEEAEEHREVDAFLALRNAGFDFYFRLLEPRA